MALLDIHVFGPAKVQIAQGTGSYQDFGYTVDGVTIEPEVYHEDVLTDYLGPAIPTDVQQMGQVVFITLPMAAFDKTVMQQIDALARQFTLGQIGPDYVGSLYFAGVQYFGVKLVPTARVGQGVTNYPTQETETYPYCHPIGRLPRNRGTRHTRKTVVMRAIRPLVSATIFQLS